MDEFNIDRFQPDKPWIRFRNFLIGLASIITLVLLFKYC